MTKETLSKSEVDQLAEITNIGAGNASTALSHMLGKKVQMGVPESFVGRIEEIQQRLGESTDSVLAIFLKMYGDIDGGLVLIFPEKEALQFAAMLTKTERKDIKEFEEMDKSALQEVGNILLGASITALGKFLSINVSHSIPDVEVDMLGAIMDAILIEMGSETEKVLAFKVALSLKEENLSGDLYYLFDPPSRWMA